jgi:DNA-binding transcriptional regulator YiaG
MTLGQAIIEAARARYGLEDAHINDVAARLVLASSTARAWSTGRYDPPAHAAANLAAVHRLTVHLTPAGYSPVTAAPAAPTKETTP